VELGGAGGSEGGHMGQAKKDICQFLFCNDHQILGGSTGHGHTGRRKLHSIHHPFRPRVRYMDHVAMIMVQCLNFVPAIHIMGCPAGALVQCLVGKSSSARWCHGGTVEIIMAIELDIRRQTGIES
jgi:hypothetical protein